jgi:hypothetical protein
MTPTAVQAAICRNFIGYTVEAPSQLHILVC